MWSRIADHCADVAVLASSLQRVYRQVLHVEQPDTSSMAHNMTMKNTAEVMLAGCQLLAIGAPHSGDAGRRKGYAVTKPEQLPWAVRPQLSLH